MTEPILNQITLKTGEPIPVLRSFIVRELKGAFIEIPENIPPETMYMQFYPIWEGRLTAAQKLQENNSKVLFV